MSDHVYTVALAPSEAVPKAQWLVKLVCVVHQHNAKDSACDIAEAAAMEQFGAQATIGYRHSSQYLDRLPVNLGDAQFTALCGWVLGRCRFCALAKPLDTLTLVHTRS